MRRFVFALVFGLSALACQAQSHLKFMNLSLDSSLDSFCSQLIKEKGLVAGTMTDDEQYYDMETKKLSGEFYGIKGCTFYVRKHDRLDNISSVIVEDTLFSLSKVDKERLLKIFDSNYGSHEIDSTLYSFYTWKTLSGDVEMHVFNKNGFKILYTDYSENNLRKQIFEEFEEEWDRQTIKEICGIPFGSSYETAEKVLENKYGTSSYLSDKTKIHYKNVSYAGILFDDIIFLFQSDGYKSYLNGCVFILEAKSLSQAKEYQDILYRKLRLKYDLKDGKDDNGNRFYLGGHSPIPFEGFGFSIEIIKFDNRPLIPYAARLMYGRYNYVKEEF